MSNTAAAPKTFYAVVPSELFCAQNATECLVLQEDVP